MVAKPAAFTPDGAPVGVEVKFVTFAAQRPRMTTPPRLQLVHTNAASGEGTIESAWNWAHAKPNVNTVPHYQIDRNGRARKMLPSNRVGIANATVDAYQGTHGDVRNWSLAHETADLGYGPGRPGDESGFSAAQAETLAQVLAYESVTHGIPLQRPVTWWGAGTGGHTEPFTWPYWTMYRGKTCPGRLKKVQLWIEVLPRARAIVAEWTAPPVEDIPNPPDEEDEVAKLLLRAPDGTIFCTDRYSYAHVVTNEPVEPEHLRDRVGVVCHPNGGPWPCDQVEADYLRRIAT